MTSAEQEAMETLRNSDDPSPDHDKFLADITAVGVVVVLAVIIGFAVLAIQTHTISNRTNYIITNGKSSAAVAAKQAAASAIFAQKKVVQAEALIGSEIAANHASGLETRRILCQTAVTEFPNDFTIMSLCRSVLYPAPTTTTTAKL